MVIKQANILGMFSSSVGIFSPTSLPFVESNVAQDQKMGPAGDELNKLKAEEVQSLSTISSSSIRALISNLNQLLISEELVRVGSLSFSGSRFNFRLAVVNDQENKTEFTFKSSKPAKGADRIIETEVEVLQGNSTTPLAKVPRRLNVAHSTKLVALYVARGKPQYEAEISAYRGTCLPHPSTG